MTYLPFNKCGALNPVAANARGTIGTAAMHRLWGSKARHPAHVEHPGRLIPAIGHTTAATVNYTSVPDVLDLPLNSVFGHGTSPNNTSNVGWEVRWTAPAATIVSVSGNFWRPRPAGVNVLGRLDIGEGIGVLR